MIIFYIFLSYLKVAICIFSNLVTEHLYSFLDVGNKYYCIGVNLLLEFVFLALCEGR